MANNSPYTPKEIYQELSRRSQTGVFSTIHDPLGEELRDPKWMSHSWYGLPVVPFMVNGETSIPLFQKMGRLSPTHGGCISRRSHYVLGGQFDVIRKKRPGFARRETEVKEVNDQEWGDVADWVSSVLDPLELFNSVKLNYLNLSKSGNAYYEIVLTSLGGQRFVHVYNHDADRCLYLSTETGMDRVVLISPFWYQQAPSGHVPEGVSLYPNFSEHEDGTLRTMIHTKELTDGREWYGEPEWIPGIYPVYNEIQVGQYGVEAFANDFTARVMFETFEGPGGQDYFQDEDLDQMVQDLEGYDPSTPGYQEGPQGFMAQLEQMWTNKGGNKRRILHRNAPADGKPTQVHQFNYNADHEFHKAKKEINQGYILEVHHMPPTLFTQTPGKLGTSSEWKEAFKVYYPTVVKPWQDKLMDPVNIILGIASEWTGTGGEIVQNFSLTLKNLYVDMLQDEKKGEETPTQSQEVPDPVEDPETDPEQNQDPPE